MCRLFTCSGSLLFFLGTGRNALDLKSALVLRHNGQADDNIVT